MGFNVLVNIRLEEFKPFGKLGEKDPFFKKLDECCKRHKGLWSKEAEDMLFEHFGGTQV